MFSKTQKNWLQIDSVDQNLFKIQYTVCGNFSQGAGTSGTGSDIAFSQLAVKGLSVIIWMHELISTLHDRIIQESRNRSFFTHVL
jgi:hypothetical protein